MYVRFSGEVEVEDDAIEEEKESDLLLLFLVVA